MPNSSCPNKTAVVLGQQKPPHTELLTTSCQYFGCGFGVVWQTNQTVEFLIAHRVIFFLYF